MSLPPPTLLLRPLGGAPRLAPLSEGAHELGADPRCACVIAVEGVSRRHARIHVRQGAAEIEDLGSKNGTWVSGRAVQRAPLLPGDELALGSARYRVEVHQPEPLALALDLGPVRAATRSVALAGPEVVPSWWPALIAAFLADLDGVGPAAAVETLREGLGAEGLWLLERDARGEVLLRTGAGARPDLSEPALAARIRGQPDAEPLVERGRLGPDLSYAARWRGARLRLLVLRGAIPGGALAPALAEIALLALDRDATGPAPTPRPRPALDFPPDLLRCPSPPMIGLYAELRRFASGRVPILVEGETGTGKEHVARLLHAWSERREGPMVALNCGAIPRDLMEAELFGVEKGAATGVGARPGRLREASGGVLFLDEVADLSETAQVALLRALQERRVVPVGGSVAHAVDVRVVSATNLRLSDRVAEGRFRADLYYRLAAVTLHVPPLRERREDIAPLCEHLIRRLSVEAGRPVRGVTVAAMVALEEAPWPGNVRQLANAVAYMVYGVGEDGIIGADQLPAELLDRPRIDEAEAPRPAPEPPTDLGDALNLECRVEALERVLLAEALQRAEGNRSQAARLLGLSRNGLRAKLVRHGLEPEGAD